MVTGWSKCAGSSALPGSYISCTSALPREVTRRFRSRMASLPPFGIGGSIVTFPFHEPASDLSWVNDFWASDWANAASVKVARARARMGRSGFMKHLLACAVLLYSTTTLRHTSRDVSNVRETRRIERRTQNAE